jgi:hypothetical protein
MMVRGILIKPLEEQHDADGMKIDPAGVTFDAEKWYSILPEFRFDAVPVGRGKVSRAEDGALMVDAEMFIDLPTPRYFAFGGSLHELEKGIREAELMSIGLVAKHTDPDQPAVDKK